MFSSLFSLILFCLLIHPAPALTFSAFGASAILKSESSDQKKIIIIISGDVWVSRNGLVPDLGKENTWHTHMKDED